MWYFKYNLGIIGVQKKKEIACKTIYRPQYNCLSEAKETNQVENYANHLTTEMNEDIQGNKAKAKKLDILLQSIARSLPVSYLKNDKIKGC